VGLLESLFPPGYISAVKGANDNSAVFRVDSLTGAVVFCRMINPGFHPMHSVAPREDGRHSRRASHNEMKGSAGKCLAALPHCTGAGCSSPPAFSSS
jgi:hypothetical protein